MISKIKFLIPVDFSEQSRIALVQAVNLARVYHADVTLLYVVEEVGLFLNKKVDVNAQKLEAELALKTMVGAIDEVGQVQFNLVVKQGKISEKIVETANELDVTLVVMAANGIKGLKKRFIGTNTMRVVKLSSCPVLTVKGENHRKGCENILLPIDLTKETEQKVEDAIYMAKVFGGASIRLVSVLTEKHRDKVESLLEKMEKLKAKIEASKVSCTAEMIKIIKGVDTPPTAILDYGEKVAADVIMIMTQQERDSAELFIGKSAQAIIHNAACPVMSIIPQKQQEK